MNTQLIEKLDMLMNQVPEEVRTIVINKYNSNGKPQSKNVEKVLNMIKSMKEDELQELKVFISSYMSDG